MLLLTLDLIIPVIKADLFGYEAVVMQATQGQKSLHPLACDLTRLEDCKDCSLSFHTVNIVTLTISINIVCSPEGKEHNISTYSAATWEQ